MFVITYSTDGVSHKEFSMKNKNINFWLGILALALVFGMTVSGCNGDDSTDGNDNNNNNNNNNNENGKNDNTYYDKTANKLYFRVQRGVNNNGEPWISLNTGDGLIIQDLYKGSLKDGMYYTIQINGTVDTTFNISCLFFKENWDFMSGLGTNIDIQTPGSFSKTHQFCYVWNNFPVFLQLQITNSEIISNIPSDTPDGTILATINNFSITITEEAREYTMIYINGITGETEIDKVTLVIINNEDEVIGTGDQRRSESYAPTNTYGFLMYAIKSEDQYSRTPWTADGDYYLGLFIDFSNKSKSKYIYTNGKTFSELGINQSTSTADRITKTPKFNISTVYPNIDFSKFSKAPDWWD